MKIAIIGTGNVGGTLAEKWAKQGHQLFFGVKDASNFKGKELAARIKATVTSIPDAVAEAELVLLATPAMYTIEVTKSLGNTTGKIIIDAMNTVMGRGAPGFSSTGHAILAHTQTKDVVKCFNTTGYNNMQHPEYGDQRLDLFVAGESQKGTAAAIQLAKDAGFAECYSIGGNDKFELMEQFAWFWINLAMFQGMGRNFGFKLLKR